MLFLRCLLPTLLISLALTATVRAQDAANKQPAVLKSAEVPETAAKPASQKPAYASAAETKLRAALSAHLRPLLDFKLSNEQLALTKSAINSIAKGRLDDAREAQTKLTEPAAAKLIEWKRLVRRGAVRADDYAAFLKDNPVWPRRGLLQQAYEAALLRDGGSAKQIIAFFDANKPVSGAGLAAQASAELALGRKTRAAKLAATAWCRQRIPARMEADFLARFSKVLTPADHKCRLDRLLIADPRSRSIRHSRVNAANRLLPQLDEAERLKAHARIKVFASRGGRGGLKELRAVVKAPKLVKDDWGLSFQRINRARRNKDYAHAYTLLKAVPGDHVGHVNRDAWWSERERHVRYWLAKGNVRRAYEIAEGVRPEGVNPAKEQAFFAGWLALMRLNQPKQARDHFKRMVAHADGPLSKSMSEYWLARAHEKAGNAKLARAHYMESASIRDTFHALLSRRAAWPKSRAVELPPAKLPTPAEIERFLGQDAVKALVIAYAAELPRRDILAFYRTFGAKLESEGELALLAQLADELGDGQGQVRAGKSGIARGFNLYEFAYPVHLLPAYEPLREPVEPALVLAIGRQESEFNTRIVSRAGARGVLQVMPITARHICRQYRIKCKLTDLINVPSYNARIASAYIADRRDEFGGSYILTLTGFNAGPGRTRQWLRQMGDPRNRSVKPLDWIYRIPFEETRLYVRKVLSNVQIYRARLGEANPLRLDEDLRRGRK